MGSRQTKNLKIFYINNLLSIIIILFSFYYLVKESFYKMNFFEKKESIPVEIFLSQNNFVPTYNNRLSAIKRLNLGYKQPVNVFSPEELALFSGIGEKTSEKIFNQGFLPSKEAQKYKNFFTN